MVGVRRTRSCNGNNFIEHVTFSYRSVSLCGLLVIENAFCSSVYCSKLCCCIIADHLTMARAYQVVTIVKLAVFHAAKLAPVYANGKEIVSVFQVLPTMVGGEMHVHLQERWPITKKAEVVALPHATVLLFEKQTVI